MCAFADRWYADSFWDIKLLKTKTRWKYAAHQIVEKTHDGTLLLMRDMMPNLYIKRHQNIQATFTSIQRTQGNRNQQIITRSQRF